MPGGPLKREFAMQIELSVLFDRNGAACEYDEAFEAEEFSFGGRSFGVRADKPVHVRIFHRDRGRFEVSGTASLTVVTACDRCLEPVEKEFPLELSAEFDLNDSAECSELPFISGSKLDVDAFALDELYVNMLVSILCRDDCRGLCKKCGANLNIRQCGCDTSIPDPRLADIFKIYNSAGKEV